MSNSLLLQASSGSVLLSSESLHRRIVQVAWAGFRCNTVCLHYNRVIAFFGAFVILDLYTVKIVRAVLRGLGGSDAARLPGGF
jgi:hypothetical protein